MKNWFNSFLSKANNNKSEKSDVIKDWSAYEEGKKLFFKKSKADRNDEQALIFLDKAVESGIEEAYFERAFCLQGLNYHYDAIEDFNQAILDLKDDANLYYRGHSKKIIADYDGAISDLTHAFELSKLPTKLNQEYDDEMRTSGWKSVSEYYFFELQEAINEKEKLQNEILKKVYLDMAKEIKWRHK